jgi:hypothetical protein
MRLVWWLGSLACGATVSTMAACSADDSTPPLGSGNDFHGTDATTQPGQSTDGGADSPFAPVDGSIYYKPDGYNPVGICTKCACPAGDYCFGGGTGYTTFSGNCAPTAFGIGCQPIPAACATTGADAGLCACLLENVATNIGCYGVCALNTLTVYCPNP